MGLKVFGQPKLTNVARVLVFLEEVGAEYEIVSIDFATGEHKSPAHIAHNVKFLCSTFIYFFSFFTLINIVFIEN
jgi:Glutathione S-transferase, N-terminal domain